MTREIGTPHLILHPWRASDLHEYARLLVDPDVMRYITHEYGPLPTAHCTSVASLPARHSAKTESRLLLVIPKPEGNA